MIQRLLARKIQDLSSKFPVVAVMGPRQSGKTTLVRSLFKEKPYVSFENPDIRDFALSDPRGFLNRYSEGAVFDEAQRVPQLLSYLQQMVDETNRPGMFILSGSQHFLLLEHLTQSLAGRVAILKLLLFSLEELSNTAYEVGSLEKLMFNGFYPRIYDQNVPALEWYPAYIETYIERDVRQLKNVHDLDTFRRFVKMCAARTGQLLNLTSLATDCGITHNTANAWINLLQASYLVYLLAPHYRNFNKRLVKSPKLHFYDSGLVCSLLGIENEKQLQTHPLRGNLFETFVMSELVKNRYNAGLPLNLYFWRDKTGHEVDCIRESGDLLTPIEIKSGKTIAADFFGNLHYWRKLADREQTKAFVIYAGDQEQERSDQTTVVSWKNISRFSTPPSPCPSPQRGEGNQQKL